MDRPKHYLPLSLSQIRAVERQALAQGLPLMQRAGQCAAQFALRHCKPCRDAWLLVGPGNNGGDALTAGVKLHLAGVSVTAVMPVEPGDAAKDARHALECWRDVGGTTQSSLPEWSEGVDRPMPDLIIDGLFGIGLNKPLGEPWQSLIDQVNRSGVPVLALDIPSGMMADTGQCLGRPVQARWTVAFIAPSLALYDSSSRDITGEWDVCTLGLQV